MKCKTVLVQAIVFAFILGIMVTGTEDAFAASLTIVNPSFEDPVLANGAFTVNAIPGWSDFISPAVGVFNPSSTSGHYTAEGIIPDGANVAYGNSGFFCQILSDTLQTNTKYTLDVDVGKRDDGVATLKRFTIDFRAFSPAPSFSQDTLAGVDSGVPVAPRIAATVPASDSFATNTIMFETGDSHPRAGQSLLICISIFGSGAQVNFDNVRLDASSVTPEPVLVDIDIKPGSDPSSVNCKANKKGDINGVVPVAIFGTADFDVSTIDLSSLELNGVEVTEKHTTIHIENLNDDGFDDAVLHLDKAGVCDATSDDGDYPLKESADATLTGSNADGDFEGTGDIRIVKR